MIIRLSTLAVNHGGPFLNGPSCSLYPYWEICISAQFKMVMVDHLNLVIVHFYPEDGWAQSQQDNCWSLPYLSQLLVFLAFFH